MGLTPKQEKYVQGLFKGLTQRTAYREAYGCKDWKESTIDERACVLAKNSKVSTRLTELQEKVANNNNWSVEKLIKEFEQCKQKCMQEVEVMKYDTELGTMTGTGEYKFEYQGVIKSLENIGKLLGMYETKLKHSGEIEINNPYKDLTVEELKKLIDK